MATAKNQQKYRLPDPPEREPDDMTSFDHLALTGSVHHLIQHFGNSETTLVAGEHYLTRIHTRSLAGVRYPDLLIAFNADPDAYRQSNAYVICRTGQTAGFRARNRIPPHRTGRCRREAERLRCTGHSRVLALRRNGRIPRNADGRRPVWRQTGSISPFPSKKWLREFCKATAGYLNLFLRWENGQLRVARPGNRTAYRNFRGRAGSPPAGAGGSPRRAGSPRPGAGSPPTGRSPRPRTGRQARKPGKPVITVPNHSILPNHP